MCMDGNDYLVIVGAMCMGRNNVLVTAGAIPMGSNSKRPLAWVEWCLLVQFLHKPTASSPVVQQCHYRLRDVLFIL